MDDELQRILEELCPYAIRFCRSQPHSMGLRLLIVQRGEVLVRDVSSQQCFRTGTLMLLSPSAAVEKNGGEFVEAHIGFVNSQNCQRLQEVLSSCMLDDTTLRKINTLLSVCAVCDDAVSIRHLLIVILRTALVASPFRDYTSPKLQSVQRWIEQHYTENCSIERISQHFHYNPAYLSRLFRQNFHCTIHAYVRSLRLRKAVELLVHTDVPIGRIAEQVGYADTQHFFRHFKQDYGMTPKTYRKSHGMQS